MPRLVGLVSPRESEGAERLCGDASKRKETTGERAWEASHIVAHRLEELDRLYHCKPGHTGHLGRFRHGTASSLQVPAPF